MAAATKTAVGNTWTECVANMAATAWVQAIGSGAVTVELQSAASAPAETTAGVRLTKNEKLVTAAQVDAVGAGDKLYARRLAGNNVYLLTL